MPMTPLERKAAFKHAVTMNETTLDQAARDGCGVTWLHLSEGIAERRPLSDDVQEKFAAYIGRARDEVFASKSAETAA